MAGGTSSISSMRFHEAIPRWSMLVTQPNAIIGHASITRYALNATSSPTVIRPATTWRLPCQSTSKAPRPSRSVRLG